MKTKQTLVCGLLAVIFVLAFTACDDGGGGGGGGGNGNGDGDTHTHSYSTTWWFNATQHWHECSCGDKTDVANHTGDPCTVCGYSSSEGSLNIAGLPSGSYSVAIFPGGTDISTITAYIANANERIASGNNGISGNVFTLTTMDDEIWTGSGNFSVLLITSMSTYRYATVNFSNGNGTAQYSSFTDCASEGLTIAGLPGGDYLVYIFPGDTDISTTTALFDVYPSKIIAGLLNKSGNVFTLTGVVDGIWTESGNFPVLLVLNKGSSNYSFYHATVSFSNGIGTAQYSSFTAVAD